MKLRTFTLCTALVTAFTLVTDRALADDKPKGKDSKAASPDSDEMMKKWEAVAKPGPAHKALEPLAGDWEFAAKWWMAPDAPPMESKGTSKAHWIMDGRFLQDDTTGEFMGMPMTGLGLTGYDNMKKKYVSMWTDNGGTGIYTSLGDASADKKNVHISR